MLGNSPASLINSEAYKSILRHECIYTSCYCEENVFKLGQLIKSRSSLELHDFNVLFISNSGKQVAFWCQKAGQETVVWDYHVIMMHKDISQWNVFDLDTTLNFPEPLSRYFTHTFRPQANIKQEFLPQFRVVSLVQFLEDFASDRSHMINKEGEYLSPPPTYPPIQTSRHTMNLPSYMDMKHQEDSRYGEVFSMQQFQSRFGLSKN